MRAVATSLFFLFLLVFGGAGSAQAQMPACDASNPCKTIRIFNADPTNTVYPIIQRALAGFDDWLIALTDKKLLNITCPTGPGAVCFPTKKNYRIYVNYPDGIKPTEYADVVLPFYSRLVDSPTGQANDEFIDWWNGNRVILYEDFNQWSAARGKDAATGTLTGQVTPKDVSPCAILNGLTQCTAQSIFGNGDPASVGLPATDRSQLLEHTFGDAITVKGRPYDLKFGNVGYNISSVDQNYLPVAMQPLVFKPGTRINVNTVPYIGTNLPVGTNQVVTPPTFRGQITKFLSDFSGWPLYNQDQGDPNHDPPVPPTPPDPAHPRVPAAYNVFINEFTNPDQKTTPPIPYVANRVLSGKCPDSTTNCPAVNSMRVLYNACSAMTDAQAANNICFFYKQIITLFQNNYTTYTTTYKSCRQAWIINDDIGIIQHMYGWVPYNDGCTAAFGANANDLLTTAGSADEFNRLQGIYIHCLQYGLVSFDSKCAQPVLLPDQSTTYFNPYVKLIHDPNYLNMAAYAFSVDDAIGFQSYPGDGIFISFAGCAPQPRTGFICKILDRNDRVVVTMGVRVAGVAEWATYGICSNEADFKQFDPLHASAVFYPPSYPCMFTATDQAGTKYQIVIAQPPRPNPPGLTTNCDGTTAAGPVTIPQWCAGAKVVQIAPDPQPNYINALNVIGNASTHDFDGDKFSDLLYRNNASGALVFTLFQTPPQVVRQKVVGTGSSLDWQIVGQRDFDGDKKFDLLWRNGNGGGVVIELIDATKANPTKGKVEAANLNLPTDWNVVGTGDFNADGLGDILWRDNNGGVVIQLIDARNTASPVLAAIGVGSQPTDWVVAGVGDFDGDGKSDILWFNKTSRVVQIWFIDATNANNPIKSFGMVGTGALDPAWSIVGTGDFNGDGKSDILLINNGTTDVGTWLMNGLTILNALGLGNLNNSGFPSGYTVAETGNWDGIFLGLSGIVFSASDQPVFGWLIDANRAPKDGFIRATFGVSPDPGWTIQTMNAD